MTGEGHPWDALPVDAFDALAPQLPALADEIIDAIKGEVPAYAERLEGAFLQTVRTGVEGALNQFAELIRDRESGRGAGRELYVALGRGEARSGRSLEVLLAAYRIGARVAWRRLATAGLEAGMAPRTLILFAESIFAYIDELSSESAEGFTQEQAERAGETERRRVALIELLVRDPPSEASAVAGAAERARWRLPRELAVVVWPSERGRSAVARLPHDSIAGPIDGLICAIVPDPGGPGRRRDVSRAFAGEQAGMGPVVPAAEAARSFRRAVTALSLAVERSLDGVTPGDDHLIALLFRADPELVAEIAARRLAPLFGETPLSRERLEGTLLAWLRHDGNVTLAAAELHVHAQTVRYRMARLRELFGADLDDPDARFELELALRAAR